MARRHGLARDEWRGKIIDACVWHSTPNAVYSFFDTFPSFVVIRQPIPSPSRIGPRSNIHILKLR